MDHGTTNHGTTNDGTMDHGTTNHGTTNHGTMDDDTTNDGTARRHRRPATAEVFSRRHVGTIPLSPHGIHERWPSCPKPPVPAPVRTSRRTR
jgi:hypothetical protein